MNTIEGAFSRAKLNSWATSFSLSPIHLLTRSEDDTLKKVDSASVATACVNTGGLVSTLTFSIQRPAALKGRRQICFKANPICVRFDVSVTQESHHGHDISLDLVKACYTPGLVALLAAGSVEAYMEYNDNKHEKTMQV